VLTGDGSAAADLMRPRLTSVAIPVDDIARRVVARALRQELPVELVARDSSAERRA
jgi:DNA-binding LacI/PurR family transcriptional regulator